MKILIISNTIAQLGGIESYIHHLIRMLDGAGHDVVTLSAQPALSRDYCDCARNYYFGSIFRPGLTLTSPWRAFWNEEAASACDRVIAIEHPDIVHLHGLLYHVTFSVILACKRRSIPIVMHCHEATLLFNLQRMDDPRVSHSDCLCKCGEVSIIRRIHRDPFRAFIKSAFLGIEYRTRNILNLWRHVDRFVLPSYSMRTIAANSGLSEAKLRVVRHCIPRDRIAKYISPPEGAGFLYAGRLSGEKGVEDLIRAYCKIETSRRLYIAGAGADRKQLEELVPDEQQSKVIFLGQLDPTALQYQYQQALCVVVPSTCFEAFGLAVTESYASGRAVIASRIGAIPENISEGVTGALFCSGDSFELSRVLSRFSECPNIPIEMGYAGYLKACIEFTEEEHLADIMAIYKEVIESYERNRSDIR